MVYNIRDENRYHGYPTLKDLAKVAFFCTIGLPYVVAKAGVDKLKEKCKGGKKKR